MCPACLTTVALVAAGAGSTSGLTALLVKKLRGPTAPKAAQSKPRSAASPETEPATKIDEKEIAR
jgi:hypothetical protein